MYNANNYTHLIYVWQYSILCRDYVFYVYGVNTNDIYHTVGEFIYRTFSHIKSIKWVESADTHLKYLKEQGLKIHRFYDKYVKE